MLADIITCTIVYKQLDCIRIDFIYVEFPRDFNLVVICSHYLLLSSNALKGNINLIFIKRR